MTLIEASDDNPRPYLIQRRGNVYKLARFSQTGRPNTIKMNRTDAIRVCNHLIDLIEQGES